jgi:hypothetical protein
MRTWTFFDANAMIGPMTVPPPAVIPDAASLLQVMDRFGIARSLFFHYSIGPEAKDEMNRATIGAAKFSKRLAPCWALSYAPSQIGEKLEDQVDRMLAAGFRAARLYPDEGPAAGPVTLRLFALERLFDRLSRRHVPLLLPAEHFHAPAAAPSYSAADVDAACRAFPELPVVLLQPKYNAQAELLALARRHKNIYLTIPALGLFRQLESMVSMLGARRLLFGTNLPWSDPSLPVGMVSYAALTETEKRQISGDNLEALLAGVRP